MAAVIAVAHVIIAMIVSWILWWQAAGDRPATARSQRARQQPVAKRHDAALQHPRRPSVGDAGPKRETDPHARSSSSLGSSPRATTFPQTASWRDEYNARRPHSSLGYRTPAGFAAAW